MASSVVLFPSEIKRNRKVHYSEQNVNNSEPISSVRIPRKGVYVQMEDIEKNSVYESNSIIKALPKANKSTLKLFELAVSGLNTTKEDVKSVLIEKKAAFEFLGINSSSNYAELKKKLREGLPELLFDFSKDEENGKLVMVFESVNWNSNKKYIELIFTDSILPYLKDIKGGFTRYQLSDISSLNSKYSIALYKIFIMRLNQYKKYKNRKMNNLVIPVKELRKMLNISDDEYKIFPNFEKRVISEPIVEINKNTNINVEYSKQKKGRSIDSITFHIMEISSSDVNDLKPRLSKAEREQKRRELAGSALASKYTKILNKELFIGSEELMDVYLMARLYEDLYPLYDQIKEKQGMQKVEQHIKYIHAHLNKPISEINDVVAYLVTCAKSLLKDTTFNKQD